ncbi:MAG: LysR family transcriptional regulator [Polyangiales bacterium]
MDRVDALRLFTRLAERGSFSAAARDLKVKQSTASKWVAALEAELGVTLVRRTTRSVQLTDAGQRLLVRARALVSSFDDLRGDFDAKRAEPEGLVRLSAPVVFGRRFIVPALRGFLERHRGVSVEAVFNDRYVNLVDEGFDLAIRVGVPVDTSAVGRKLADARRVLVASPKYLRARGAPQTPRDLKAHSCLAHGDVGAARVWRFAREDGAEVAVPVRGRFWSNSSEAALVMARGGLGVALLADWLVRDDLARGRLVALLEGFSPPPAPIYALRPPERFPTAGARALSDHLAAALAANPGDAAPARRRSEVGRSARRGSATPPHDADANESRA